MQRPVDQSRYDFLSRPTQDMYEALQRAYEFFNWRLFDDKLPNCLITLQRRKRSYGYFAPERFRRDSGERSDEIALNPAHFQNRPLTEILATLAHEMVHLWQHHFGQAGRGRYHNRQWADQMKSIGLQPTSTGEEGGRETGDSMSHLVVAGGVFEQAAKDLQDSGFAILWCEYTRMSSTRKPGSEDNPKAKDKSGQRVKYSCPSCGLNAWARHDAALLCGTDKIRLQSSQ